MSTAGRVEEAVGGNCVTPVTLTPRSVQGHSPSITLPPLSASADFGRDLVEGRPWPFRRGTVAAAAAFSFSERSTLQESDSGPIT